MMDRRFALLPLLALIGASLSGCVAEAIPALAETAMVDTRNDNNESKAATPVIASVALPVSVPSLAPIVIPTVTVDLAAPAAFIAIAGDERPDFDESFKYLRNPEAGAELEPVIGDGRFLIEPILPVERRQGK